MSAAHIELWAVPTW